MLHLLLAALLAAGVPLVEAARNVDVDGVRSLIKQGVDVNAASADGTTALHWASYRDNLDAADLLIRAGARVDAANDLGATPLWIASTNGSAAMVRRLLEAGAHPNVALLLGETPLMAAARSGNPDVVAQLIEKGAGVNARGARGQTPLMWAVSERHPDVVKVLLSRGADIQARSEALSQMMAVPPHVKSEYNRLIPFGGETALLFAARVGDLASAKLLLAAGADVNDKDAWGVSAMVLAAHSGFTGMVEYLLDNGADANAAGPGFTALHEAIMRRDTVMVKALLDHGANPNTPLQTWTPERRSSADFNFAPAIVGATPFWLAARFAEPDVMRLLAARGADATFVLRNEYYVNDYNDRRTQATTAVMAALGIGGGRAWVRPDRAQLEALVLESVKLAIELGVDVNAVNTDGRSALDIAKPQGLQPVVKLLIDHGARDGKELAAAQPQANFLGMWSDPPFTAEDTFCAAWCTTAGLERLEALLDNPANDKRPFADLSAEADRYQRDQYIRPRLSDANVKRFPLDPAADPGFLRCEPWGVARQIAARHQLQIRQPARDRLELRYGEWDAYRTVYLDGRQRPAGQAPTAMGFSVGRYEGGALVIETTGIAANLTSYSSDHSSQLRIVERYTRSQDGKLLSLTATLDDPVSLRQPIELRKVWSWAPASEIAPYKGCQRPTEFSTGK